MKRLVFAFVGVGLALLGSTTVFGQFDYKNAVPLYSPVLIAGGGFTTVVTVTNLKNEEAQVNLFFKSQTGYPLEGTFQDGSLIAVGSQYIPIMPGNSSRQFTFSLGGDQVIGYFYDLIPKTPTGEDSLTVSLQIDFAPTGSVTGQATIFPTKPVVGLGFYAESSSGQDKDTRETVLAVINPGAVPAKVTITLKDALGKDVGSCQPFTIQPYSQIFDYVKSLCQLPNPYRGLVKVVSTVPVVGTALQTTISVGGVLSFSVAATDPLP